MPIVATTEEGTEVLICVIVGKITEDGGFRLKSMFLF